MTLSKNFMFREIDKEGAERKQKVLQTEKLNDS